MTLAARPLEARYWSLLQADAQTNLPQNPAAVLVLHSGLASGAILTLAQRWKTGDFVQIFSFSHTAEMLQQGLDQNAFERSRWLIIDCISSSVRNVSPKPNIVFENSPNNARQLEIVISGHEPRDPYKTMVIDSLSALLDGPLAMDAAGTAAIFKELGILAHERPGRRLLLFLDERHRDAFTIPALIFDCIIRIEDISGFG